MPKTVAEMLGEATPRSHAASEEPAAGRVMLPDIREPVEREHHWVADPTRPNDNGAFDPSRRWIVYCRSGVRATLACVTLTTLGDEHVADLEGGSTPRRKPACPAASVKTRCDGSSNPAQRTGRRDECDDGGGGER
jgi:rhodanese-related sulfurtransferase